MTDFKFDFLDSACDDELIKKDTKQEVEEVQWLPAKEIIPNAKMIEEIDDMIPQANLFIHDDLEIGHVYPEDALRLLKEHFKSDEMENSVLSAESQHSDLVTAKYEGGLKVWECTADLIDYLSQHEMSDLSSSLVLDLGCGAGLLGIMALMQGGRADFQDYNEEVIHAVTIPNVLLNIGTNKEDIMKTCRFFSGDWGSLSTLMDKDSDKFKYNYILTSETIYNTENHLKLYNVIKDRLKKDGKAFVAAKTYYFGVGGGMREFEDLVKKDGCMECEVCWKSGGGVKREILKMTFKEFS